MRKVLLLAALLLAIPAMGQKVQLANNGKCDATSQVKLMQEKRTKSASEETATTQRP